MHIQMGKKKIKQESLPKTQDHQYRIFTIGNGTGHTGQFPFFIRVY